ncbi:MAG: hypothetical protein AAB930_01610, partial [Patescibacteria group bacterium]
SVKWLLVLVSCVAAVWLLFALPDILFDENPIGFYFVLALFGMLFYALIFVPIKIIGENILEKIKTEIILKRQP